MKIVGVYPDSFEASLAKGRLEDAGIEACLTNEYVNDVMPWGTPQDRWVRLAVADENYEAAMTLLAPSSEEGLAAKGKVCPHCGSEHVSLGLKGRRRWAKVFWLALATLTMSPPGKVRPNYYCEDCRREF
ncbi:MAG: DUF2007 domain-containing protein [Rikenellaceae bacterium]|nr:DUF2007 domain-containing protein [Rikenellaceae bacterium]